jgi:hypothetical protein
MTTLAEAIAMGSRPVNAHVEKFEPAQVYYVRIGYHDGRETFGRTYRQKANANRECVRIHRMIDRAQQS